MMSYRMTAEEYLRVELATKRESYSHRRWPEEVVRAIAGAEVISGPGEPRCAAHAVPSRRLRAIRFRLRLARLRRRGARA